MSYGVSLSQSNDRYTGNLRVDIHKAINIIITLFWSNSPKIIKKTLLTLKKLFFVISFLILFSICNIFE